LKVIIHRYHDVASSACSHETMIRRGWKTVYYGFI
jgi:hypothetical protein